MVISNQCQRFFIGEYEKNNFVGNKNAQLKIYNIDDEFVTTFSLHLGTADSSVLGIVAEGSKNLPTANILYEQCRAVGASLCIQQR